LSLKDNEWTHKTLQITLFKGNMIKKESYWSMGKLIFKNTVVRKVVIWQPDFFWSHANHVLILTQKLLGTVYQNCDNENAISVKKKVKYIQNIRHFVFGTDFITGYIRWAGMASLIYPVIKSVPKTKCLIFCLSVIYN
jgi:hypothetical protein